jgi:hypothetical protein
MNRGPQVRVYHPLLQELIYAARHDTMKELLDYRDARLPTVTRHILPLALQTIVRYVMRAALLGRFIRCTVISN